MKTMKVKCLALFFLFAALTRGDSLTLHMDMNPETDPDVHISKVNVISDESGQALFYGEDIQWPGEPGEPRMPWKRFAVLLEPRADLSTVFCGRSRFVYEPFNDGWSVKPVPPIAGRDEGEEKTMPPSSGRRLIDGYDVGIYGKNAFWPEEGAFIPGTGKLY